MEKYTVTYRSDNKMTTYVIAIEAEDFEEAAAKAVAGTKEHPFLDWTIITVRQVS